MDFQKIHEFDQQCTLALNSIHSDITDPIMQFFSNIPVWIPMYATIAAIFFWRLGWKKALLVIGSLVMTFVCCDQLSNFIKVTVARPRPCHDIFMIDHGLRLLEKAGGAYGFFSGHAANSFGFAVCSYIGFRNDKRLKYRGYAAWIFSWATLMSISRVFVGKHYIGDIIVGAIAGTVFGLIFACLARLIIRKFIDYPELVYKP